MTQVYFYCGRSVILVFRELRYSQETNVLVFLVLFLIYVPMGVCGYFSYGSGVESYIVKHISTGPIRCDHNSRKPVFAFRKEGQGVLHFLLLLLLLGTFYLYILSILLTTTTPSTCTAYH